MLFMNQWEIESAASQYANRPHPVLSKATRFLASFVNQVNSRSDGWAYWAPPVRAAAKLITLIQSGDATEAQYAVALRPIKSFYTRRGYAAGMTFPEE